jgi:shikimate dehydrogenase
VAFAFAEMTEASAITILGRTPERVDELVGDLQAAGAPHVQGGPLAERLERALREHDIIVQGTSVGMEPNDDESIVPADLLRADQVVFDMVYRPHETRLLRDAARAGCTIIHGIEMLIHQAALQFERWTSVPAPIDAMRAAATKALS